MTDTLLPGARRDRPEGTKGASEGRLLQQYGCGPVSLSGTEAALYERHLLFDNVVDVQAAGELRDVPWPHLEKEDTLVGRQVMRVARFAQLVLVFLHQTAIRPVGNDSDRCVGRRVDEFTRRLVGIDAVHSQLRRAEHARGHGRDDDRDNENRCDLDAFGTLDDVDQRRVTENEREQQIAMPCLPRTQPGQRHCKRC